MPVYDRKCVSCDVVLLDKYEPYALPESPPCPSCGAATERVWFSVGRAPTVIGDECDVWIKHGICEENGEPRHFTSKAEIARVAKEKGLRNRVEHLGTPHGDRSPHTSRWI